MHLLSVILPVYNAAPYLEAAIESVLNQTFTDFELIIINDASTDDTDAIVKRYAKIDERIFYIRKEKNLGLVDSLNKGIALAKGSFIARMDGDDVCDSDRFRRQLQYFNAHPDAGMVCSPIIGITPTGKERDVWPVDFINRTNEQIRRTLPWENCISHPTVMLRAEILKKYQYDPKQKGSEDWDLWLRMARDGVEIVKTAEILLRYRIHPGSVTRIFNSAQSPQIKSARVKWRFFRTSMASFKLNGFVLLTLFTIYKDLGYHLKKHLLPRYFRKIKWFLTISPIKAQSQFKRLKSSLSNHDAAYFLFFPYSHLGGAEKVHAMISRVLEAEKPFVFITGIHDKGGFEKAFSQQAPLLKVGACLYHPLFSRRAAKLIKDKISSHFSPFVFGCNNRFFYSLLAQLPEQIKKADLTHDYDYECDREEAETLLPVLLTLQQRIFVSRAALQKTIDFYSKNFVDDNYTARLRLTYNAVDLKPASPSRTWHTPYKVLYVGRDTAEKNLDLLFKLADECLLKNLSFEFHLVGELLASRRAAKNLVFHGKILDRQILAELYAQSHFVIITSVSEGFPLSLGEGMLSACIPLSTGVGDVPHQVNHGFTGIVVNGSDQQQYFASFMKEFEKILSGYYDLVSMSAQASQQAQKVFSIASFEQAYRELFQLK